MVRIRKSRQDAAPTGLEAAPTDAAPADAASADGGLLEFPCVFPIKIMGRDEPGFRDLAVRLVTQHVGELADDAVRSSRSNNGNYLSVTVTVDAQSQEQLDAIYRDLTSHEKVKVVL